MKSIGKDFKGEDLFIGDTVLFAEYSMDSNLYKGVLESQTEKTINIKTEFTHWKRVVKKKDTSTKLLKL